MQEENICISLGTDGQGSGSNLDMFETMKYTALLQKGYLENPTLMPAYEVLKMATINGAKTLNLENQKCRFVETTKIIISPDGRKIQLVGKVILLGDIAPTIKKISGGQVIINDIEYEIYQASRPRNPDGTVHHTTLELI